MKSFVARNRIVALFMVLTANSPMIESVADENARGAGITAQEADEDIRTRWAFLIGINNYATMPKLDYCAQDMEGLRQALVEHGGYTANCVRILTDGEKQSMPLTSGIIRVHLRNLLAQVQHNDSVLFAFAGHGEVDGADRAWLMPFDGIPGSDDDLALTAIPVSEIYNQIQQCPAKQKLIILDACHSGATRSNEAATRFSPENLPNGTGIIELLSCRAAELSYESPELRHGVFSHFLATGIAGDADVQGDQDGVVTVAELYQYSHEHTKKYVGERFRQSQTPKQRGDVTGQIPIAVRTTTTPMMSVDDIIARLRSQEKQNRLPKGFMSDAEEWLSIDPEFQPAADIRILLTLLGKSLINVTQFHQLSKNSLEKLRLHIKSRKIANRRQLHAVIIAIDDYEPLRHRLRGSVRSGTMVRDVLKASATSGDSITMLTNTEATKANVTKAIRKVTSESKPGDIVVLYFSGHGDGQTYLKHDGSVFTGGELESRKSQNVWVLYDEGYLLSTLEKSADRLLSVTELEAMFDGMEGDLIVLSDSAGMHFPWSPLFDEESQTSELLRRQLDVERTFVFVGPAVAYTTPRHKHSSSFCVLVARGLAGAADTDVARIAPRIFPLMNDMERGALASRTIPKSEPSAWLEVQNTAPDGFVSVAEFVEFFRLYERRSKEFFESDLRVSGHVRRSPAILSQVAGAAP
ncbi:caspase family protein [Fuerstiella marisgermanici]|uniref:Peptidase C14 caspase domain-containing protein n=1 Tax=Fuerstiella marisgermanici TaxID=1891926 RepID=A0A1P8WGR6_9PLAN|nr:caspase family protein [Fuerstiella marisgermanici]APZ93230.1 putative protein containing caspase domain protein [Fuerstiella marisgermanici]